MIEKDSTPSWSPEFRKTPSPLGWLFAAASVSLSIAFVVLIAVWSERLHQALVIRYSLGIDRLHSLEERELNLSFHRPASPISSFIYKKLHGRDIADAPEHIKRLILALWHVGRNNLDAAEEVVNSIERLSESEFSIAHPELTAQIANVRRKFSRYLTTVKDHERKKAQIAEEESTIEKARREYQSLRADISDLFSLEAPSFADSDALSFYEDGVLRGLPSIPSISDNISSLDSLEKAVEEAGGSLELTSKASLTAFQERLSNLSSYSRSLEETVAETTEDLIAGRTSLSEMTDSLDSVRADFMEEAQTTIENNVSLLESFDLSEFLPS